MGVRSWRIEAGYVCVCVNLCVCMWFRPPFTPAAHPRTVYIFGGGPQPPTCDPPATHPEPQRPRQRRRAAANHPRPTRDPPRAAATHPEAAGRRDPPRAAATHPKEMSTPGGPPRPNHDPSENTSGRAAYVCLVQETRTRSD